MDAERPEVTKDKPIDAEGTARPLASGPSGAAAPAATPGMDRRRFLALAGLTAAGVAALSLDGSLGLDSVLQGVTAPDPRLRGSSDDSWVMLIDLAKCDGCGKCTKACQKNMHVPFKQEWIRVYRVKDEHGGEFFLPRPCMNCRNAPCVEVCPVKATYQGPDGVILVDQDRCVGCRYCLAACPYNARSFTWTTPSYTAKELDHRYSPEEPWPLPRGVAEKCVLCAHLAREGELPFCVSGCPMGAIYLGNERDDAVTNGLGETLAFRKTLDEHGGFRWKEELGTEPRVYYLPAGSANNSANSEEAASGA